MQSRRSKSSSSLRQKVSYFAFSSLPKLICSHDPIAARWWELKNCTRARRANDPSLTRHRGHACQGIRRFINASRSARHAGQICPLNARVLVVPRQRKLNPCPIDAIKIDRIGSLMRASACIPARNASRAYLALPGLSHTFINCGARSRSQRHEILCIVATHARFSISPRRKIRGEEAPGAPVFVEAPLDPATSDLATSPNISKHGATTTSNYDLRERGRAGLTC